MPSNLFSSNYIVWRPLFSFHLPSFFKLKKSMSFQPTTFPTKTHPMPLQRSIGIRTAALQGFHINGEFDGIYSCLGPEIIQTCLQSQLPTMEVHGRKLGSAGIHHVDVPRWSGQTNGGETRWMLLPTSDWTLRFYHWTRIKDCDWSM